MSKRIRQGAVLFAKDLERMANFYSELFGLERSESGSDFVELESTDSYLVVHAIPAKIAATITITDPPARRSNTAVTLVFPVRSIIEARERSTALGGSIDPDNLAFEARGFRACNGVDPEGNVIQLRELIDQTS